MTAATPRIKPLTDAELTDDQKAMLALPLDDTDASGALDFFKTLLRHPGLYRRFAPFAGKLLVGGKLPARDREIAILRCAWRCQAPFEWGEHVRLAREAGLSADDIERVTKGPADAGWSQRDRSLLEAVDELQATAHLSDETWSALAETYDERQLIELPFVIGAYQMIAYVQNALQVALPKGSEGLAAR